MCTVTVSFIGILSPITFSSTAPTMFALVILASQDQGTIRHQVNLEA